MKQIKSKNSINVRRWEGNEYLDKMILDLAQDRDFKVADTKNLKKTETLY